MSDAAPSARARLLAAALAPHVARAIALYAPEVLVVAGPIARDPAMLQVRLLRAAVERFAPALAGFLPPFVPSAFGLDAAAVAAGALVLEQAFALPLTDGSPDRAGAGAAVRRRLLARTV